MEYLVKWMNHLVEACTWMSIVDLRKTSYSIEDLISRSS